ncbi:nadh-ubiquinone oxidoreductase 39 kda [Diplogelasinospora grovesii]|uniref:Protein-lysine N-methyltransferase EFM5 n=1 Tax=Diplogelasinospora grovesii TaxID=303347 RepID=A0AAN6N8L2_9PEZI|nr:nadh-ubiquinone oxidoreductase 39 kda [Diplogelasinospora grovesii]
MASLQTAVRSTPKVAKGALQRRAISDVAITRTGKPILRSQGYRSSIGGHTATVFGATGALGRYIVNRLARQGCQVIIPYREEMAKRHLKVTGDLGRVVFMEYDLRNTESIEASVRHSDVVYNLVGRNYPTKNFSLEDVHVEGTERIAEAVAKYDVDRFIHVSSYNANPDSTSEFFATKGRGEQVARSIFPETTIVRPAPMFGFEDNLLLRLASVLNLFTANNMQERYSPVHVIDVGKALEKMLYDDTTASQTYELYGPKNYSTAEIAELVDREIYKKRRHINVPKAILKPVAGLLNKALWWPVLSADEVEREFHDQVIDESAKTFKDLGIEPGDIANFTYHYLDSAAQRTTIYRQQLRRRGEKKGNTSTSSTTSEGLAVWSCSVNNYVYTRLYKMTDQNDDEFGRRALSSSALDALKQFYAERDAHQQQFAKLQAAAEQQQLHSSPSSSASASGTRQQQTENEEGVQLSMDAFMEDWQESQFWIVNDDDVVTDDVCYSDETATHLARQLLQGADITEDSTVVVVSAPSVFVALKNLLNSKERTDHPKPKLVLLEHDNRFAVFSEFVFYDYMTPLKLPGELKGSADRVILDPPFLNEDCQTKAALTVRWLSKPAAQTKLVVCTGERMETLVTTKLYKSFNLKTTDYEVVHARGLSNEFYCYANFENEGWKWRPQESEST